MGFPSRSSRKGFTSQLADVQHDLLDMKQAISHTKLMKGLVDVPPASKKPYVCQSKTANKNKKNVIGKTIDAL